MSGSGRSVESTVVLWLVLLVGVVVVYANLEAIVQALVLLLFAPGLVALGIVNALFSLDAAMSTRWMVAAVFDGAVVAGLAVWQMRARAVIRAYGVVAMACFVGQLIAIHFLKVKWIVQAVAADS